MSVKLSMTIDRYAVAKAAFDSHAAAIADYTGERQAQWCELSDEQTEAWVAAAVAAISMQACREALRI